MKEEITDMIKDEAYADPKFKKGLVLKFAQATLRITRVDRKNRRAWAEHITTHRISNAKFYEMLSKGELKEEDETKH